MGQPSWSFGSGLVRATLTRQGGHLAPVTFRLESGRTVQPYSVAPWATEGLPRQFPDLLRSLRGDFFCCPFGGNGAPWRGEQHPPHGETANGSWSLVSFESGAYASGLFLDAGWPAVRLFASDDAGHMFGRLPVGRAIRWLEALASDDPKVLLDFAEARLAESAHRDATAALRKVKGLKLDPQAVLLTIFKEEDEAHEGARHASAAGADAVW